MTALPNTDWYVAQIKPNGLKIALRNLGRQGFQTFAPLLETTVQRRGKFVQELKPLFSGYVFVHISPDLPSWRSINNTHGVSRVISFGQEAAPEMVPEALMAALKARCDDGGVFLDAPKLKVGDQVMITQGPFAEFVATVTRLSSQERVWVLLDVLGRGTPATVPQAHLERI